MTQGSWSQPGEKTGLFLHANQHKPAFKYSEDVAFPLICQLPVVVFMVPSTPVLSTSEKETYNVAAQSVIPEGKKSCLQAMRQFSSTLKHEA